MHNFEKVTTKKGDGGQTSLGDGRRLPKSDPVFVVLGNIDELNAALGVCRSGGTPEATQLEAAQRMLLVLGALVANSTLTVDGLLEDTVWPGPLSDLEEWEADLFRRFPDAVPDRFILPGDNRQSAFADLARTICRRAERSLVFLMDLEEDAADSTGKRLAPAVQYLNRLSDALFVYARTLDKQG